ncbi:T-cell surface glycoprotein CD4 T-cell surface antigen T4/Leu-3 Precursor [Channa argus]|uniref:T-cell surface glycoprotein CD4 T-cell surface antigen T4/Leu-3 n=1 Tax=Channa argus TaxID=215402 RepID=A0A6G1PPD8_CHAAH|nr:T-cell surface glycoprotein CD4 T-cell surface antigen T4/Leu-3 Precursor [Channa argus]
MGVPRKGQNELVLRSRIMQETKLEISKVKEEDAGLFSCRADGTNYEHTLLVVSVSASPSSELELHNKVQLHCEVKGFKQDPKVEWRSPDGSVKDPTFNIDSVTPAHSGNWVCDITYDGKHHKETLIIKVKEPAPATTTSSPTKNSKSPACPTCATPSKVSWWVWVAVGVGGFVMILLMVCVIVLCKRIKRRKKKMQRMKKGRLGSKQYCQCNRPVTKMKDLIEHVVIFISLLVSTRADEVVYAQVGERVTLKASLNTQNKYLYWKSGKQNKQLAWRNPLGGSGLGEHIPKGQYTLSGDTLIINNITEEDFGNYICEVKNEQTTTYQLLRHSVNRKPQSPLLPGDRLFLSCDADAPTGHKPPEIYWVNPQNEIITDNLKNVEATSEHHGQWTCVVKNINKEHNATVDVTVVGLSPAPSHPLYTSKSSPLTIPCTTSVSWEQFRAKGLLEVYWEFSHKESSGAISNSRQRLFNLSLEDRLSWKEDTPNGFKPVADLQKGKLSLTRKQGREYDRGDYNCTMKFKNGVELISTVQVEVLNIIASPGIVLNSGQELNLTCGHNLSSDLQLKWTAPKQSSYSESDPKGPHFTIPKVGTEDSGKWVCELWRNDTKLTSDVIKLKIEPRLSVWMLVTICSGAVIVILILIVVFILYRRRQVL